MYDAIASPICLGGVQLKNRIIFAPTTLGLPWPQALAQFEAIAAGGCAMLVVGDVPVGKSRFGPNLYSKKGAARYRQLVHLAHRNGCLICAQLHQSDSNWKGMLRYLPAVLAKKITPDRLRALLNAQVGPYITGLPAQKVKAITASFGPAARAAQALGFDMVQVHGDRMCGSFASALFNTRKDEYGGSPQGRARFAVECVQAVRRAAPGLPIDFKLAVRQEAPHYGNAGVLAQELPVFVPLLEQAGVTSFHVALADHSALEDTIPPASHPYFGAEGCFLPFCDQVKALTRLPVCGVGGLTDPDFVERQLAAGRIDCAAMSRQLIADPRWPAKVAAGQAEAIHRCVRCNQQCLGGLQRHQGVHCIHRLAQEREATT